MHPLTPLGVQQEGKDVCLFSKKKSVIITPFVWSVVRDIDETDGKNVPQATFSVPRDWMVMTSLALWSPIVWALPWLVLSFAGRN
jgi:hypothetical protein